MLKSIIILTILVAGSYCNTWDFFLFVQLWPASWLYNDGIKDYNFTNNYWNVHGIWIQYRNGTWPQFCNKSQKFNANILKPISENLTKYWTDFKNPPSFWKHEYLKHLTCINQTDLYEDYKYFWYGLELREKLNIYNALLKFDIVPSNDHFYSIKEIMNAIKKTFGYDVIITCSTKKFIKIIEEVRFCMDKQFKLFDCPKIEYKESCKGDYVFYNFYVKEKEQIYLYQ